MAGFSAEAFAATLALVGVVILIAALLSGLIERVAVPQVAVFLALGAILGPAGLGMLGVTLESPILRVVATLSLTLVLFTDAVSLNITEIRRHSTLALLVLGPGTLLTAALVTLAGWWLLGLPVAAAAILGAALSSTDPVLLRGLLRRHDIPGAARQALRLESGLNDVVLLPLVFVAMAFLSRSSPSHDKNWARLAIDLFLLGPGAGIAVGLLSVATLDLVRRRIGVRRDYESLYSLGVAFAAFAAAESVHGSGFLAAFAAGLTIAALDVELCDCFLEYGETTAEMALLFTFVLFGSSLIWSGFTVLSGATLLFTAIVLLVRPVAFLASLAKVRMDPRGRQLIAWFGPRGLSSLLLVLLPVFAGLPGSERLFAICCLVVLVSVLLHGGAPMLLTRRESTAAARAEPVVPPAPALNDAARTFAADGAGGSPAAAAADGTGVRESTDVGPPEGERISLAQMRALRERGEPLVILDARSERSFASSDEQLQGAVRLSPDRAPRHAAELGLPPDAWLVTFCA
jgi:sodium/hydrogen antiporter